ncbi:putative transcriptional regulatory protein [Zalerion maritima]|uniref:Transcriptional regulatory protein n=1 Tax=Zalerion maritima TaxID=339359 RepID=A0AAD5RU01_9PEZI|nr:putative transcriptional regulatory protein [Zalerion maritima]
MRRYLTSHRPSTIPLFFRLLGALRLAELWNLFFFSTPFCSLSVLDPDSPRHHCFLFSLFNVVTNAAAPSVASSYADPASSSPRATARDRSESLGGTVSRLVPSATGTDPLLLLTPTSAADRDDATAAREPSYNREAGKEAGVEAEAEEGQGSPAATSQRTKYGVWKTAPFDAGHRHHIGRVTNRLAESGLPPTWAGTSVHGFFFNPGVRLRRHKRGAPAARYRRVPRLDRRILPQRERPSGTDGYLHDGRQISPLLLLLLVLDLGLMGRHPAESPDDSSWSSSGEITGFCKGLVGRLVGQTAVESVQIVFLLALNLRYQDDIAAAWPMLGLCSIYCFEKLLAFELGRSSSIIDEDNLQLEPTSLPSHPPCQRNSSAQQQASFGAISGLAKLLGDSGRRCIRDRNREASSVNQEGLESAIAEKVKTTGETCLMLTRTPDLIPNPRTFPYAALISMHYYNASFLVLTRNSLFISEDTIRQCTNITSKDKPWNNMIRHGQYVAAKTARQIVELFIEAEHLGTPLLLPNPGAPLHAFLEKQVVHNAGEFAKQRRKALGFDSSLDRLLEALDSVLLQALKDTPSSLSGQATPQLPNGRHAAGLDDRINSPLAAPGDDPAVDCRRFLEGDAEAQASSLLKAINSDPLQLHPRHGNEFQQGTLAMATEGNPEFFTQDEMGYSPSLADEIGWDWKHIMQLVSGPLPQLDGAIGSLPSFGP